MPPKKKACLKFDPNNVYVVNASTTKEQIPRNVRIARVDGSVHILSDDIFRDCDSLEEVIIDEGVHIIGKRAFFNCNALAKVKLPSTLREILGRAFYVCKSLCSIDLPVGLQVVGDHAFSITGLRQLEAPGTVERIEEGAFGCCKQLESIVLPPRLAMIADGLFWCCEQLTEIDVPTAVKRIGSYAFRGCATLHSLDLSHCIHCVAIGSEAFQSCEQLSFIYLPPNLESIEKKAFFDCPMLTHFRIPPNVTFVGNELGGFNQFASCASLVSLEVPEGLESIDLVPHGWCVGIADCSSLVNLYMPPLQKAEDSDDSGPFPEGFQLAKVAQDWGDLVKKLQHRFDGLPLHKICYFHSYHPMENTIQRIRENLIDNPSALSQTDAFGMIPFHIVALAQKPPLKLLRELLPALDVVQTKDLVGSTVLEYLSKNPLEEGRRATRWLVHLIAGQRLPFLRLDRWKQELLAEEDRVVRASDRGSSSNEVRSFLDKLAHLEFLEALSLVEMKLWGIKLHENSVEVGSVLRRDKELQHTTYRQRCRVQCGISIVVENVLPFAS